MKKKEIIIYLLLFQGQAFIIIPFHQGYPVAISVVVGVRYPVAIGPGITSPEVMATETVTITTRIANPTDREKIGSS
jgi:hypothetical protein